MAIYDGIRVPDFIMVGAMKAGTTDIADAISKHPTIFSSPHKEPSILIDHSKFSGMKIDLPEDMKSIQFYQKLFSKASIDQLCGEYSTQYLVNTESPKLISKINNHCKIIISLRNPIKRCYSAFHYNKSLGIETAETLLEAVNEEIQGKRDKYYPQFRYVYSSRYEIHIENYKTQFSNDNIHILFFENYINNKEFHLNKIFNFLEVDGLSLEQDKISNPTGYPKGATMQLANFIFKRPSKIRASLKRYVPLSLAIPAQRYIIKMIDENSTKPTPISKEEEETLQVLLQDTFHYIDDNFEDKIDNYLKF